MSDDDACQFARAERNDQPAACLHAMLNVSGSAICERLIERNRKRDVGDKHVRAGRRRLQRRIDRLI